MSSLQLSTKKVKQSVMMLVKSYLRVGHHPQQNRPGCAGLQARLFMRRRRPTTISVKQHQARRPPAGPASFSPRFYMIGAGKSQEQPSTEGKSLQRVEGFDFLSLFSATSLQYATLLAGIQTYSACNSRSGVLFETASNIGRTNMWGFNIADVLLPCGQ